MKRNLIICLLLLGSIWGCGEQESTESAANVVSETPPAPEMPDDFYAAVREKGGAEPFDNVYYVAPDSISYQAYYYNLQYVNAYAPQPGEVEAFYQDLMGISFDSVVVVFDDIQRVFERGGDIGELNHNGKNILRSNADNSTVTPGTWPVFNDYCNAIRNYVLSKIETRIQRVDLEIEYQTEFDKMEEVTVETNNFQLVGWTPRPDAKEAPTTGYNAILPGDYHLVGLVRAGGEYFSVQDTLQMRGAPRRLKLVVFSDRIEINKLN